MAWVVLLGIPAVQLKQTVSVVCVVRRTVCKKYVKKNFVGPAARTRGGLTAQRCIDSSCFLVSRSAVVMVGHHLQGDCDCALHCCMYCCMYAL